MTKPTLPPGPEMDALVAEKVMGVEPKKVFIATNDGGRSAAITSDSFWGGEHDLAKWIKEHPGYVLGEWKSYPQYSTKIEDAWLVVEKLGIHTVMEIDPRETPKVTVGMGNGATAGVITKAETLSHAICLAALKAVKMTKSYTTLCCNFRFIGMNHSPEKDGVCRHCGKVYRGEK